MGLDLHWDRASPWIEAGGRRLPRDRSSKALTTHGQRWWVAGIPFENRAALLLIVDETDDGTARDATVQPLLPAVDAGWVERLEAVPCAVVDQRIRPCIADNDYPPEEFLWLLTDGLWARVDDGAELHRYTDLFGSLAVVR